MYIDFKVTTWERVEFDSKKFSEEEIKEKIKSGEIENATDLMDLLEGDCQLEQLNGVDEQMSVEENLGNATIEAFNINREMFCKNGE